MSNSDANKSGGSDVATARPRPDVDLVIPVYNEQKCVEDSVRKLHKFASTDLPVTWNITIVDNASTDGTWGIVSSLADELSGVRAIHLDQKGRGRALRAAWSSSPARVAAYMDVDLSTDLGGILPLVAPLLSGHSELSIGTRLVRASRVTRGAKREFISRSYNVVLRIVLRARFSDAQCGFKAIRTDVGSWLIPQVEDENWFFDTEMLVRAQWHGLRIHEVPVDWIDDLDSRVNIPATAWEDLKGVMRLCRVPRATRSRR